MRSGKQPPDKLPLKCITQQPDYHYLSTIVAIHDLILHQAQDLLNMPNACINEPPYMQLLRGSDSCSFELSWFSYVSLTFGLHISSALLWLFGWHH